MGNEFPAEMCLFTTKNSFDLPGFVLLIITNRAVCKIEKML